MYKYVLYIFTFLYCTCIHSCIVGVYICILFTRACTHNICNKFMFSVYQMYIHVVQCIMYRHGRIHILIPMCVHLYELYIRHCSIMYTYTCAFCIYIIIKACIQYEHLLLQVLHCKSIYMNSFECNKLYIQLTIMHNIHTCTVYNSCACIQIKHYCNKHSLDFIPWMSIPFTLILKNHFPKYHFTIGQHQL